MLEIFYERLNKYFTRGLNGVSGQFARYFMVALVGLFFDFGTLVVFHDLLHIYYLFAAACGFVVGLAVNYVLSTRYVFKNSKLNSRVLEFALFGLVGLIGLGVLSISMWLLVSLLGIQYLLAKCLATVAVYAWNFVGRKAMYRD
jgi:putative flippase GtrA